MKKLKTKQPTNQPKNIKKTQNLLPQKKNKQKKQTYKPKHSK